MIGEILAGRLRERGADRVFGVPGGGPNLEVIGAAEAAGLAFVLAHGETAGCIMASTYGLLTGSVAMAIATRGPGAASAVNGAAQATLDRYPLLLVTDCVPARDQERVAHQRLDQRALMAAVTKWSGTIGSGDPAATASAAISLANSGPRGAVHLDFDPTAPSARPALSTDHPRLVPAAREQARRLLAAARRPVAIVGFGAVDAAADVRTALESLGCPVLTTYQAVGVFPDGHHQLAGLYTNGAIEDVVLAQADLVLAVGLDTVEPMPPPWRHHVPVVALSAEPVASTFLPATLTLQGSLPDLLDDVVVMSPGNDWHTDSGAAALAEVRAKLRDGATTPAFGPIELVDALIATAPDDATVTVDAGAHFLAVMPFWPVARPLDLLISNGLATMGFAVPAAIAAALARPGRPVLCCVGDGGLGMTLAELETIVRLDLPITVVVFDDAALSLIEIKQQPGQGAARAVRFVPIDFAAVATAMGMASATASTPAEIRRILADGWRRPRVVDARIDPAPYRSLIRTTRG